MQQERNSQSQQDRRGQQPAKSLPLKRGLACRACRSFKIKCDGEKPVCGPCLADPKEDPCEYDDPRGRSRYQHFKDTITALQAHIHELEDRPPTPSHEPNTGSQASTSGTVDGTIAGPQDPHDPSETTAWTLDEAMRRRRAPQGQGVPTETILQSTTSLIQIFRRNSTQLGFFLDEDHFASVAVLSPNDPIRPCEAVIAAVCLWGCHFSPANSSYRSIESLLLNVALHDRSANLIRDESNPRRILHTLQAEVLLAYYFIRQGDMLEARVHTADAAALVRGAGLQNTHAAGNPRPAQLTISRDGYASLVPAGRNVPETGEMLNAFWAVYVLVQHLIILDPNVEHSYGLSSVQIDCPWPLDTQSYRNGILPPPGWQTIQTFLDRPERPSDMDHTSALTMMTKATVLLRGVTDSDVDRPSLTVVVEAFCVNLPPVLPTDPQAHILYMAHALANAARLKLYADSAARDEQAWAACLSAVHAIFLTESDCDLYQLYCVSPVIGEIWRMTCAHLVSLMLQDISNDREISLQELYKYGRALMASYCGQGNVLMVYLLSTLPGTA